MAIEWMDDFTSYGTSAPDLGPSGAGKTRSTQGTPYTNQNSYIAADPVVVGGFCLEVGGTNVNSNTADNNYAIPNPATAIGIAFRYYTGALPSSAGTRADIMQWRDFSNNRLYVLRTETNGALTIYDGSGTLVQSTLVPVITAAAWWHIETMLDYATGQITVYVEGTQVLNISITIASTIIYNLGWSSRQDFTAPFGGSFMKDFIQYDKSGSHNNAAGSIAPVSVFRLVLNSDVSNGWTITGGTTVSNTIESEPPDDAGHFISAGQGPFPAAAITTITHLPASVVGVRAIQNLQRIKKSDGGDASYQIDIVSGSSTHTGTTHNPTTSYAYAWDVVELDPATGALWSPIAVNNLEVKIDRTV